MEPFKTVEIQLSKRKLILLVLGCMVFAFISLWLLIRPPVIHHYLFGNRVFIGIFSVLVLLLSLAAGYSVILKLNDPSPGLVVSSSGVTDNSTALSIGHVLWADVAAVEEIKVARQRFMHLEVYNPEDYLQKQKNWLKRMIMKSNLKLYGTVISLTANTLTINHAALKELLEQGFEAYQNEISGRLL